LRLPRFRNAFDLSVDPRRLSFRGELVGDGVLLSSQAGVFGHFVEDVDPAEVAPFGAELVLDGRHHAGQGERDQDRDDDEDDRVGGHIGASNPR
jgi:hypothetical protein